jgi:hypothetical protein
MHEYLRHLVVPAWPVHVVALAYTLTMLYCARRQLLRAGLAVTAGTVAALLALFYLGTETSWVRENRPIAMFLLMTWIFSVLIAVLFMLSRAAAKIRSGTNALLVALLLALVVLFVWPTFALVSACVSGVDCI